VQVTKIAGQSNVSVTLNIYAEEFDKAMHRDDLMARIEKAGFGAVQRLVADMRGRECPLLRCEQRKSPVSGAFPSGRNFALRNHVTAEPLGLGSAQHRSEASSAHDGPLPQRHPQAAGFDT
jgi:hypothetical protein